MRPPHLYLNGTAREGVDVFQSRSLLNARGAVEYSPFTAQIRLAGNVLSHPGRPRCTHGIKWHLMEIL